MVLQFLVSKNADIWKTTMNVIYRCQILGRGILTPILSTWPVGDLTDHTGMIVASRALCLFIMTHSDRCVTSPALLPVHFSHKSSKLSKTVSLGRQDLSIRLSIFMQEKSLDFRFRFVTSPYRLEVLYYQQRKVSGCHNDVSHTCQLCEDSKHLEFPMLTKLGNLL